MSSWQNSALVARRRLHGVPDHERIDAGQTARTDRRLPAEPDVPGTSCRDCSRCRGWSKFATSSGGRISTTPKSRRSRSRPIPANLDPALREERTVDGTLQRPELSRRWAAAAGGSAATFRSSTRFPIPPNLMTPSPRVVSRELMTRDAVSAGHDPQSAGRGLDPVHGARLVRAQAHQRPRTASRSRSPPATTGPTRTMRVPRTRAGPGARRVDASAGLRQPQQPLVGRIADLRLRSSRRGEAAHRRGRQAEGRSRRSCCPSIRTPACT